MKTERSFSTGDAAYWHSKLVPQGFKPIKHAELGGFRGAWFHAEKLEIFSYCEGDTVKHTFDTVDEFNTELQRQTEWYRKDAE